MSCTLNPEMVKEIKGKELIIVSIYKLAYNID